MKNLNILRAVGSSLIVYIIGITAFVGSYYIPLMPNEELQANIFLMLAIVPAAYIASSFYYKSGQNTSPAILGLCMFIGAIILDATITVPVFMIPLGVNHLTFFSDPFFWLIGLEYILVVMFSGRKILRMRFTQI